MLTLKLELNSGNPDNEYIGIFTREWTLGKGGDINLLYCGVPLPSVTSNNVGEIMIPNDFYLLERGEFDFSLEEISQTIMRG